MIMTIITDDQGNILGAVQGHSLIGEQGEVDAGLSLAQGHRMHRVEVDDDLAAVNDAAIFEQRLKQYLQRHLRQAGDMP